MKDLVNEVETFEGRVILTLKPFSATTIARYPYMSVNMKYITYLRYANAVVIVYKDGTKKTLYKQGIKVINYPLVKEFFYRVVRFVDEWEGGLE